MSPAGRPKKPANLKVLQGTYRPARTNPGGVFPELTDNLQAPEWLPKEARDKWNQLAPTLQRNGLLTECDLDTLTLYCQTWVRYLEAEDKLQTEGSTTTAASGYTQVSAWVTIAKNARSDLLMFGDRLGLSPSARGRIHTEPMGEEDEYLA